MNRPDAMGSKSHDAILEDHRDLRKLLARIDESFKQRTLKVEKVGDLLMQLGDQVHRHFAFEEKNGYFDEAMTRSPHLSAEADKLMLQHAALAANVRHLTAKPSRFQSSDEWWDSTRDKFDEFHSALTEHEQSENRLLQDAYLLDLGAND